LDMMWKGHGEDVIMVWWDEWNEYNAKITYK